VADPDEGIWINHRNGLHRLRGEGWLAASSDQGSPPHDVEALCGGLNESLLALGRAGVWRRLENKWKVVVADCPDFKPAVTACIEGLDGGLWVATYNNGLYRLDAAGEWRHFTL